MGMNYMEEAWKVSLLVAKFYAEERYTDKYGHVWLGVEGETHDTDQWVREDGLGAISSADMTKKMINELHNWDDTPVEDAYEYSMSSLNEINGEWKVTGDFMDTYNRNPIWRDRETTEKMVDWYISDFPNSKFKMVKRRKAGPVEDA